MFDTLQVTMTADKVTADVPGHGRYSCAREIFNAYTIAGARLRMRDVHDGYAEDHKRFLDTLRAMGTDMAGVVVRIMAGEFSDMRTVESCNRATRRR